MKFDGVLFFPVTAFAADGSVDTALTAEHVASRLPFEPGGVIADLKRVWDRGQLAATLPLWTL